MEQNKLMEETPQYKAWVEWWTEMNKKLIQEINKNNSFDNNKPIRC